MRKVLIVDDELLARRMLKESIVWEEYGYSICGEAANGKDGLEKAVQLRPDLIFVDIKMPVSARKKLAKEAFETGMGVRYLKAKIQRSLDDMLFEDCGKKTYTIME